MPRFSEDEMSGSTHNAALNATRDTVHGFKVLPGLISAMIKSDRWRRMVRPFDGRVFTNDSLTEWVLGEPWGGLNFPSWDALYAVLDRAEGGPACKEMLIAAGAPAHAAIADMPAADTHGGRRVKSSVHCTLAPKGNSAARIAARLKRDHPEIAAAAERGEYRSMRAAGIAAGIVKVTTWNAPLEPQRLADAVQRRFPGWKLVKEDN